MDDSLDRRLGAIERRLREIETTLSLVEGAESPADYATATPPPLPTPMPTPDALDPPAAAAPVEPTTAPVAPVRPVIALGYRPPPRPEAVAAAQRATQGSLEQTIGLKWAGWVGAVVLVIGAALGFKFAYDQGWLGLLPDGPKVGLLALCGIGLLAAGEYVYRRINQLSAAGLFGAGVAVLFLASYAGHAWYGLFAQSTAMALMGASALTGILIAGRADLVSIAVLAIIGGNLAPVVLGGRAAVTPFLCYLLFLQLMALALCAWQARPKWWVLRGVSLVSTSLWLTYLASRAYSDPSISAPITTTFTILFAVIYQAELLFTRRKVVLVQTLTMSERSQGVIFSLLATAAMTGVLLLLTAPHSSPHAQGGWIICIASATAVIGWALRFSRAPEWADLSVGFRVQAMLLLMLAVPVTFEGPSLIFGWMLLAVGLAVVAKLARSRASLVGALVTWGLAITAWAIWAFADADALRVWLTIAGQQLQARLILGAALALSGHVIALTSGAERSPPTQPPPRGSIDPITLPLAINVLAAALMVLAVIAHAPSPSFATCALLVYAWALLVASYMPALRNIAPLALTVLAVAALKWVTVDVLQQRLSADWVATAQRPLLNAQFALGLALAVSAGVMGWLKRPADDDGEADPRRDELALVLLGIIASIVAFAFSMEVDRALVQAQLAGNLTAWPQWAARMMLFAMLWTACLVAATWIARMVCRTRGGRAQATRLALYGSVVVGIVFALSAVAVAAGGTPAGIPLVLNLQVLSGVVVVGGVGALAALDRSTESRHVAMLALPLLLLVTGSAEIDRYAAQQSAGPPWIVRQVGWSIYWSGLAVMSIVVGFVWSLRPLRLMALGLLAITLLKVVIVDLSGAGTGWRILSFLGLGALLLGTSVLYGKFDRELRPRAD